MDVISQGEAATSIITALVFSSAMILLGLFVSWIGYKGTSDLSSHAKVMCGLLAFGFLSLGVGLYLMTYDGVTERPASWVGPSFLEIGLVSILVWVAWFNFLRLRMLAFAVTAMRITRREIVGEALLIAVTVGIAVSSLLFWTSGLILAAEVGATLALLTSLIAFVVVNRKLRQRSRGT